MITLIVFERAERKVLFFGAGTAGAGFCLNWSIS